jgi:Laminin G domain
MFRAADAYIKSVTLAKDGELMAKLRKILTENILVNVRTHQKRALILHAYDHFNNFVMLHIEDEHVVFSFNSGNKIEVRTSISSIEILTLQNIFVLEIF